MRLFVGKAVILLATGALIAATSSTGNNTAIATADAGWLPKDRPSFLEVHRSRRAKIVFAEGHQWAWFEQAELSWGDLALTAGEARIDTAEGIGELSGGVLLTGRDLIVKCERCTADAIGAEISFPAGLEGRYLKEDLSLSADQAHLYYLPDTGEPYKTVLAGNVVLHWKPGAELHAPRVVYRFGPQTLELTEGFQVTLATSLLPSARDAFTGDEVEIVGEKLFVQPTETQRGAEVVSLSGSGVTIHSMSFQAAGRSLIAKLAFPAEEGGTKKAEFLQLILSGSATTPVTGSWLRQDGRVIEMSARRVEKLSAERFLALKGSVHLSSSEFDLSAARIELQWERDQLKVVIPQRFRMNLTHEFIEGLSGSHPAPGTS
ncbi:MAG: hypothetical protein B1H03_02900 [Planctomycetales bacterium 4484_113]|nr:MAG: hypothetical protein B1H03_02900 [Planctomycetales bacterium 4484_113]